MVERGGQMKSRNRGGKGAKERQRRIDGGKETEENMNMNMKINLNSTDLDWI